jgi:hypothetical protein
VLPRPRLASQPPGWPMQAHFSTVPGNPRTVIGSRWLGRRSSLATPPIGARSSRKNVETSCVARLRNGGIPLSPRPRLHCVPQGAHCCSRGSVKHRERRGVLITIPGWRGRGLHSQESGAVSQSAKRENGERILTEEQPSETGGIGAPTLSRGQDTSRTHGTRRLGCAHRTPARSLQQATPGRVHGDGPVWRASS